MRHFSCLPLVLPPTVKCPEIVCILPHGTTMDHVKKVRRIFCAKMALNRNSCVWYIFNCVVLTYFACCLRKLIPLIRFILLVGFALKDTRSKHNNKLQAHTHNANDLRNAKTNTEYLSFSSIAPTNWFFRWQLYEYYHEFRENKSLP